MTVTVPRPGSAPTGRHHHEFRLADPRVSHDYGDGSGGPVTLHGPAGAGLGQPTTAPVSHPPTAHPPGDRAPEPTPATGVPAGVADPAAGVRDAGVVGYDVDAAMLRGQVAGRMRRFNALHADHAWTRRYRDPIAAHGVAFLYGEPGGRGWWSLRAATRLVLDAPEVVRADLMLFGLIEVAEALAAEGPVDPRVDMADRSERMTPRSVFIGVGLSTLDTPARRDPYGGPDVGGTWSAVKKTATGASDVAGRCYAALTDGTAMLVERGRYSDPEPVRVYSTHMMQGHSGSWAWLSGVSDEHTGPGTGVIWQRLAELRNVVMGHPR